MRTVIKQRLSRELRLRDFAGGREPCLLPLFSGRLTALSHQTPWLLVKASSFVVCVPPLPRFIPHPLVSRGARRNPLLREAFPFGRFRIPFRLADSPLDECFRHPRGLEGLEMADKVLVHWVTSALCDSLPRSSRSLKTIASISALACCLSLLLPVSPSKPLKLAGATQPCQCSFTPPDNHLSKAVSIDSVGNDSISERNLIRTHTTSHTTFTVELCCRLRGSAEDEKSDFVDWVLETTFIFQLLPTMTS